MREDTAEPGCGPQCVCTGPSRAPIPVTLSTTPLQRAASALRPFSRADAAGGSRHLVEQAVIPSGAFKMGDSSGDRNRADGEVPVHEVSLEAFQIDVTPVTNADFARF